MLIENTLYGEVDKVKIAVKRLQLHEPPEGYYVAFSGGTFEYFGQPYCCWCGRKIAKKLRSRSND